MSILKIPAHTMEHALTKSLVLIVVALTLILTACSNGSQTTSPTPSTGSTSPNSQQVSNLPVVALPGYQVSLFASGTADYTHPDSLAVDNGHVFIDYQNLAAKAGGDNLKSTIVEYTMDGKVVKTFSVPGHSDGMRIDPSTHLVWATSNEDGNPSMATIDPNSGAITPYTFAKTPHGGGYDDVYFLNGKTYIAASNPSLDKNGTNPNPAVDQITLSGGKVSLTPVLMGNASATDTVSNSKVTLTLTDPDSLATDANGDLILISQADSEIIYIKNPGTPQQSVTRTMVGTQLDDTVWIPSATGRLLIADGVTSKTYWLSGPFKPGAIYTQTPDDSTVAGLVGQIDPATGITTGIAIGFSKPTGMIFVAG